MSKEKRPLGGIIHTYQKYDPITFPSPTQPPPDMVSPAFEHLLHFGNTRRLTEEELARAVRIDPSQIANLGPSLDHLRQMLEERKKRILETYETGHALNEARTNFHHQAEKARPPKKLTRPYYRAVREEQLYDMEQLWYQSDEQSPFARDLLRTMERLGEKYQVDELDAKYDFTGREPMSVPKALEIKEELEALDRLLKQIEEAAETAQIGVIDLEELAQYAEPGDMDQLANLQRQVEEYLRHLAEQQGIEQSGQGYQLNPQAYRLFQSKLLERIFADLQASRTGRHQGPIIGEGSVEMQQTKSYEFGDSVAHLDIPTSFINALVRDSSQKPVRLKQEDLEIHRTRNNPRCATVVLLDMSGSMRYDGQYVNVKRMGLALDGLIRKEYPGDFLQFVEMYTFAKPRHLSEIAEIMPKPVTIYDPVVRLWVDMSDPDVSEMQVPPHFTNIQHALNLSRKYLATQDTPNKNVILITDGLPTAHFEGEKLFLLYPPTDQTEEATLREAHLCARDGITINIFLLQTWNQSREDVQFAYRLAESTKGRVFFTAGNDLDRYVVWDYHARRRSIIS